MDIIYRFRKHQPDFNFTTDVIVGFPGETEADFMETVKLSREARFSHIHTFRYSRRKGTRADRLEDQLGEKIKAERSEVIRKISKENRIQYMNSMIGREQRVLVEKVSSGGVAHGYGEHYLPIDFRVENSSRNVFRNVVLEETLASDPPLLKGSIR
jgi:threonylcarbamoyladenosine tRNA methylthiotransferase MtaB